MPRCWPSAAASVDLPAPIIPAMPMKMLPKTSGDCCARVLPDPSARLEAGGGVGARAISVCTLAACQSGMTPGGSHHNSTGGAPTLQPQPFHAAPHDGNIEVDEQAETQPRRA